MILGSYGWSLLKLKAIRISKSLFKHPSNIRILNRSRNPLLIIDLLINLMLINMSSISNPNPNLIASGQVLSQLDSNH